MKRILNNLRLAAQWAPNVRLLMWSYLWVPVLVLSGFGFYLIIAHHYWLPFLLTLSVCSLLPFLCLLFQKKRRLTSTAQTEHEPEWVAPSAEWGEGDRAIWQGLNDLIQTQLSQKQNWQALQGYALEIVTLAATEYGKKALSFSTVEGLMLLEELSRRYRNLLLQHVPAVEHLPCSWLHSAYTQKNTIRTGMTWSKHLYDLYRAYRLFSPMGLISELKGQVQNKALSGISDGLTLRLKQAFLQEVAAVAIDLYSGRFRIADNGSPADADINDQQHFAEPLAPLRVCVIGQVSSGKSSLINALLQGAEVTQAAEVDSLPSTDQMTVYPCVVEGCELMHLVDLPGFNGQPETEAFLLDQATHAQVILWVLKANQPARAMDVEFKRQLDAFYEQAEHRSHKKPVIIGVLTQVDRLIPRGELTPPTEVDNKTSIRAAPLREALQYNKDVLNLDIVLPLSLAPEQAPYNLEALERLLDQSFQQGVQVQLNQRRHQMAQGRPLKQHLHRIYQSGKSLFQLMKH